MATPRPYFLFPGTAREALTLYQRVFGGQLQLNTFAEFSRNDGPPDDIAHGVLTGPVSLYAADAGADEATFSSTGLMFALLGDGTPAQLHAWFDGLAEGGTVIDPLQERPWGASDGQVIDAFGVKWLLGYEQPAEGED
ncbi:VOC family protein [Gryllotalpicola ginsengisoli]|uniref:VOC family protein n=1 Tax=Gryllotalpicola ginsengisoli TaxID=444608 RepID=UPI000526CFC3|nr:VOC family protein [Gryllotalpicola ginsengisoli]